MDDINETRHDGMSTGLFSDEEDGYNLDETKYKLKVDAEVPQDSEEDVDFGDDAGLDMFDDAGGDTPADDKPFEDEPFDAGVEADEDEDPKTYIQQLSGKLGQSLRQYTNDQGSPDHDLEKFAINSVVSATHSGEMSDEDQDDIIDKVKTSGKGEGGDVDVNVNVDQDGEDADVSVDKSVEKDADGDVSMDKEISFDDEEEVKEENFDLFTENDNKIKGKLDEHFNSDPEPVVKPETKPETQPDVKPSRRQKTWKPKKSPKIRPKMTEDEVDVTGYNGRVQKIVNLDNDSATLVVNIDGEPTTMEFNNTGEYGDKPRGYDEPWVYWYETDIQPNGKQYTVGVDFFGHPDYNLDLDGISDMYVEEK